MKKHLTDRTLKSLKPAPASKRYDVWDSDVPGMAVRVSDKGSLTFMSQAAIAGGVHEALNLHKQIAAVKDLAKDGVKFVTAQASVPIGQYTAQLLDTASAEPTFGADFKSRVERNTVSKEDNGSCRRIS